MGEPDAPVDKGLVEFRGRPMIAWVIERIAGQLDELFISANRNQARYGRFGPKVSSPTRFPVSRVRSPACMRRWRPRAIPGC